MLGRWLWGALAVALFVAVACKVKLAEASMGTPMTMVAMQVPMTSTDSMRWAIRWKAVADQSGPVTSYLDSVWVNSGLVHTKNTTATADTFTVARPLPGGTITLLAHVRAVRGTQANTPATLQWAYTEQLRPLPPPDSLKADTVATSLHVMPDVANIAVGDSVLFHAVWHNLEGDTLTVKNMVSWSTDQPTVLALHPRLGTPDCVAVALKATSSVVPRATILRSQQGA